ncbi:DNA polymerase IV [Corynebacterium ulcerans]|uniref:DNA-directed DNA polymerase n=1 Tax=Corynebacterium ulcerans TaxID=65058 RepID=A0ABD0BHB0_CORUL|nr:DNA polymerase IV [Corynebacterium ulcerans 0102]GJJ33850.1 DNA polymerase IV [Corynebacterium ulcerans]GJJ36613.1 DNA polymerase IV [Corynebacterium ulcerans]GJJ37653.1 DNA polymerase IV [Corynebacterium ulcerans]GJJ40573.1 DNA polymerase IV [Corynebacterium ulcerans]
MSGRGVVAGASYEARALGAHSAMPMYQAKRLVGFRGVIVAPRFEVYRAASHRVFEILHSMGGLVEQVSVDEGFMEPEELQGATSAEVREWAHELRRIIRHDVGLPASVGAGCGKQFAKIGSDQAKPDGVFVVPPEKHEEMILPLPVGELWGVGPVTRTKLKQLGVETIGDLAAMTQREVDISLGTTVGRALWMMARGIDDRPVAPRAESKQISAEHTYPKDLINVPQVDDALRRATDDAHRRLLNDGRGARTVTVKLRMADFHIESRSATLPYATDDHDTFLATAMRLVRYPDELGPIRLVGVSLSGLEMARQDVLFPEIDREIVQRDSDFEVGVSGAVSTENADHQSAGLEDAQQDDLVEESPRWRATQDVWHPELGHGWIQGIGHGKVTVRFETRTTGIGKVRTFDIGDSELQPADPVASLDWDIADF